MHLHVLGIGGTFMSAVALLARGLGYKVTGSDANCYPPISDLLAKEGIVFQEGYEDATEALKSDLVIVGNAAKRGMPVIEALLDAGIPYVSGPEWLAKEVLQKRRVLAVSGTHGKTTTTSMLAHILDSAGFETGFLIGGIATNFGTNARLGQGEWFVIEADEYDSAFFDKRPKFMHYRPECAILNNLEFDHADIYPNLAAIQKQIHYFLKTMPPSGELLYPLDDKAIEEVVNIGVYSHASTMGIGPASNALWRAEMVDDVGRVFRVYHDGVFITEVHWSLMGEMNVQNALSALAASVYAGVEPAVAAKALSGFSPIKRRLELRMDKHDIKIYDDFAHHPTAIEKTIKAVKSTGEHARIWVVLAFASHSMRMGVHGDKVAEALKLADGVCVFADSPLSDALKSTCEKDAWSIFDTSKDLVATLKSQVKPKDAIVVMSNKSLEDVHQGLIHALG